MRHRPATFRCSRGSRISDANVPPNWPSPTVHSLAGLGGTKLQPRSHTPLFIRWTGMVRCSPTGRRWTILDADRLCGELSRRYDHTPRSPARLPFGRPVWEPIHSTPCDRNRRNAPTWTVGRLGAFRHRGSSIRRRPCLWRTDRSHLHRRHGRRRAITPLAPRIGPRFFPIWTDPGTHLPDSAASNSAGATPPPKIGCSPSTANLGLWSVAVPDAKPEAPLQGKNTKLIIKNWCSPSKARQPPVIPSVCPPIPA